MRNLAFLLLIVSFSITTLAQDPKPTVEKSDTSSVTSDNSEVSEEVVVLDENEEFKKAISQETPETRVPALLKFIADFPESEQKSRVLGLIVSGRAEMADDKLRVGEKEEGIRLFKLAVQEVPVPITEKLYKEVILQIPGNLFWRGERVAALEVAKIIEEKIAEDSTQMIALAGFHISIENAPDAITIAKKVIERSPDSIVGYQTLGLAYRLNFELEKSAEAYAKALEFDTESISALRSLAEMKRATGNTSESIALYQKILEKDSSDLNAQTGLILSLFDSGNVTEAEIQFNKSIEVNPNNLILLVGAAYWYAAKGDGEKAVELSQKALAVEPRYVWGYIALARGLMKKGDPLAAERTLFAARKYGNFPTLQYEIASTRLAAGFYRDAIDELKGTFTVKDGILKTKLGGRLEKEAENFTELLSLERQASIFEPISADNPEIAEKLKKLLSFAQNIEAKEIEEAELVKSADDFINGDDKMKTHRQLFIATQLLAKKKALPKVLEITKDSVKGVDAALEVINPGAAVLADVLYDSRRLAFSRGTALVIPDVPRQTLSKIIRGRIEELAGWALFNQEKSDEAIIRLKRAVSVLPKDSAWLRSSYWRMGNVFQMQGKDDEALDSYIKGYLVEEEDPVKKIVIEALYKKINGNLVGLQERLETKPQETNTNAIFVKKTETKETKDETPEEKSVNDEVNKERIPETVPVATKSEETQTVKIPENINSELSNEIVAKPALITDESTDKEKTTEENQLNSIKPKEEVKTSDIKSDADIKPSETKEVTDDKLAESQEKKESRLRIINTPLVIVEDKILNKNEDLSKETSSENKKVDDPVSDVKNNESLSNEVKKVDNNTTRDLIKESIPENSEIKKADVEKLKIDENISTNLENNPEKKEVVDKTETNDVSINSANILNATGATRPRFVQIEKPKPAEEIIAKCKIFTSQDVVSLINNGGRIGILLGVETDVEKIDMKAISSSPKDIEAVYEPGIGRAGHAFFVIQSISTNLGEYKITFEMPCGKKEILVKVR